MSFATCSLLFPIKISVTPQATLPSGMQVSLFSLGGGPLGGLYGKDTEKERIDTVLLALKSGINYIDTAPFYGNGRSEELLGKVWQNVEVRMKYTLPSRIELHNIRPAN